MLLEVFWRSVDPTDGGGQFCDRGVSYETAVFVTSLDQRRSAEASKKALMSSGALKKPIVTKIEDAGTFYPAEDYHQGYYKNNPMRYRFYRYICGRDHRVEESWVDQAYKGIIKYKDFSGAVNQEGHVKATFWSIWKAAYSSSEKKR